MNNILNKSICNYIAGNPNNEEPSLPTFLDIGYYDAKSTTWQSIIKNALLRYVLTEVKEITVPGGSTPEGNVIEPETYCAAIYTFKIEANQINNTIQLPRNHETGNLLLTFALRDNSAENQFLLESDETTAADALSVLDDLITNYSGNTIAYMVLTWQIIVKNASGTDEQWKDQYQQLKVEYDTLQNSYNSYELNVNSELRAIIGKEGTHS